MFLLAQVVAFLFDKSILKKHRVVLFIFSVQFLIAGLISLFNKFEFARLRGIIEYIEKRQTYNQSGGGGIDISTMSFPEQIWTYIFRPLPFEAHNFTSLVVSFDNLFLLFIFILFIKSFFMKSCYRDKIDFNIIFMIVFSLSALLILSTTTANLGISVRQKWMFLPFLIFIAFYYIGGNYKLKKRTSNKAQ